MAKRTSKKVRKAKNVNPTMVALSSSQDENSILVDSPPTAAPQDSITAGAVNQLSGDEAQILGAADVGLTPSAYVYADTQEPEPPIEDIIEAFLDADQQAEVRHHATIEVFGKPIQSGREAIVSRLDSKLKEL